MCQFSLKLNYKAITLLLYIHIYIVVVVSTVQIRKKKVFLN